MSQAQLQSTSNKYKTNQVLLQQRREEEESNKDNDYVFLTTSDDKCMVTPFKNLLNYDATEKTAKMKISGVIRQFNVLKRDTKNKCDQKRKRWEQSIETDKENASQMEVHSAQQKKKSRLVPTTINRTVSVERITSEFSN
jgi:hypothetical protein